MKRIIRALSLLIVLCIISGAVVGCNKENKEPEVTSDISENAEFELTLERLSEYVIVVPSEAEENMNSAATSLQSIIEKFTKKKLDIVKDDQVFEYEILIGLADREETRDFYTNVRHYDTGYALVGKKVLIIGRTNNAAGDSVMLFKMDILDRSSSSSVLMRVTDKKLYSDKELNDKYEWYEQSRNEYYSSALEGVTINAIGDSYFNYSKMDKKEVWLSLLAEKYNMQMNNYGKGGSTVSNYVTNKNPMCDRYKDMFVNEADIILIEGGANDITVYTPIGDVDSNDEATFSGALNVMIDGIQERYPNAMIVCITMWNIYDGFYKSDTIPYIEYANAMERVAERQGVYFIAAYDTEISGVDMSSMYFRSKYCMRQNDSHHLNAEGMKIAMAHFEKVIAEYYEDFLSKKITR